MSISYVFGFLSLLAHVGILFMLLFCRSNIKHQFYFEILLQHKMFKLMILLTEPFFLFTQFFFYFNFTLMNRIVSYTHLIFIILKTNCEKGNSNAFLQQGLNAHWSHSIIMLFSSDVWVLYINIIKNLCLSKWAMFFCFCYICLWWMILRWQYVVFLYYLTYNFAEKHCI